MDKLSELWRRIVFLFRGREFERDLEEEMSLHLALKVAHNAELGDGAEEARYAAQRRFGNRTRLREISREMWGWRSIEILVQDLRYAVRMMARNPGFTAVAVFSLALGIGVNTAIFSLIDAVMLRSLPVREPQRLITLEKHFPQIPGEKGHSFSYPAIKLFSERNRLLDGVLAFSSPQSVNLAVAPASGDTEKVSRNFVSGNYFEVLGVQPMLGRLFTRADDQAIGGAPYGVISYAYWKRRFGLDPAVLGRKLIVDEVPITIVGVAPPAFTGAQPGVAPEIWMPATMSEKSCLASPGCQAFSVMARLKPGVSRDQALAELGILYQQHLNERAESIHDEFNRKRFLTQWLGLADGRTGWSALGERYAKPLFVLMAVVGLVLLIACANVANLLLARAAARQREVAVRLAIGAGRARLIRQLLTESSLLAFIGGALGLAFAWAGSRALIALLPDSSGTLALDARPDPRVLAFTAAVSIVSGLLFGLAPALRASRTGVTHGLNEKSSNAGGVSGRFRLGKLLVASQVAMSLVVLIGGGLFVRSLRNLRNLDTGFNRENVLMFSLSAPHSYNAQTIAAVRDRFMDAARSLPGVSSTGDCSPALLSNAEWDQTITVDGYVARADEDMNVNFIRVSRDFFQTIRTPLLMGRSFDERDTLTSPKVVLVNESLARYFFGSRDPVGVRLSSGGFQSVSIAGVVRDSKLISLREKTPRTLFILDDQFPSAGMGAFVVRTAAPPDVFAAALRPVVTQIDASLAVEKVRTLTDQLDSQLIQERMIAKLSAFFALLALALAAIGLYGVMSYSVLRRTNEIGIRMALGAESGAVLRQVLGETLALVVAGMLAGCAAGVVCSRWIASMLYNLKPTDPATILSTALLLAVVALLAGYIPARRAARVDPMIALRYE